MNRTTHSVYITSGTLGAGFIAYNEDECLGDPLPPTGSAPYLQGANGGQKCVALDTVLLPAAKAGAPALTEEQMAEYRVNSVQFIQNLGNPPPA